MRLRSLVTRQRLWPFALTGENLDDLVALTELMAMGTLTPVVERTYELRDAAQALAHVGTGHTRGKVTIRVRGDHGPAGHSDVELRLQDWERAPGSDGPVTAGPSARYFRAIAP